MVRPTITYNASTGSSTSSGSGESKLTGSTATVNGGDPGTVIDLDGTPDLSGLTADTSAIYLNGIGLYRITAVNDGADQVTVHTSVSLGAGVSWGIGGTRDNPRSDTFADEDTGEAGWTYEFETGAYAVGSDAFQPPNGDTSEGPTKIVAASGASPTFTTSTTVIFQMGNRQHYIGLAATISATGQCFYTNSGGEHLMLESCSCSGTTRTANRHGIYMVAAGGHSRILNCSLVALHRGIWIANQAGDHWIDGCDADDCTNGFQHGSGSAATTSYWVNCVAHDGERGFENSFNGGRVFWKNCVAHSNSSHGFDGGVSSGTDAFISIYNCVATSNGGYGITVDSATAATNTYVDYCAFWNNTSGEKNNIRSDQGQNDISLTEDPYTNSAADDYTPSASGGLRQAGYPSW